MLALAKGPFFVEIFDGAPFELVLGRAALETRDIDGGLAAHLVEDRAQNFATLIRRETRHERCPRPKIARRHQPV